MREHGIAGLRLRRRVRTTVPEPADHLVPDLLKRDFTAPAPNQRYVGDITYLPIAEGTNLCLATVSDCHSGDCPPVDAHPREALREANLPCMTTVFEAARILGCSPHEAKVMLAGRPRGRRGPCSRVLLLAPPHPRPGLLLGHGDAGRADPRCLDPASQAAPRQRLPALPHPQRRHPSDAQAAAGDRGQRAVVAQTVSKAARSLLRACPRVSPVNWAGQAVRRGCDRSARRGGEGDPSAIRRPSWPHW